MSNGKKLKKKKSFIKESVPANMDMVKSPEQADPRLIRQAESLSATVDKLVHSDKTQNSIVQIIGSGGPPEQTIPQAATLVFDKVDRKEIPNEVRAMVFSNLVVDLIEIGTLSGAIQEPTQEQVPGILQASLQEYIIHGVKKGILDPVQLQKDVEKIMSPEQVEAGHMMAQRNNVPVEPTAGQALAKAHDDEIRPVQQENEKLKGLLAQTQGGV